MKHGVYMCMKVLFFTKFHVTPEVKYTEFALPYKESLFSY
jgi:hypothetical protein